MGYLWAVKTFGPWLLILLLVGGLLFMRGNLIQKDAEVDAAAKAIAQLVEVNTANAATIERQKAAAALNDQTEQALNAKLSALQVSATATQEAIKKVIANDPKSKAWADMLIPDELRGTINQPR